MRWTLIRLVSMVLAMKLYFAPLACSLATRIALYEAGAHAEFVEVDTKAKRTEHGADFCAVHSLGQVPVLALDDGDVLTENAAVLQFVAASFPEARLVPRDAKGVARLHQWLSFIGTELHKGLFVPLLDEKAPKAAKDYALEKASSRLSWVEARLEARKGHAFLFDDFSIADAYLVTVLNWSVATPVDLSPYAAISAYVARMRDRPHVARALREELALYLRERARARM